MKNPFLFVFAAIAALTTLTTTGCNDQGENETVAVTGVAVKPTFQEMTVGQTAQLEATVAPENATDRTVAWSSKNETVATVDGEGLVTAVAPGETEIVATTRDGGKTAVCRIEVKAATTTVPVTDITVAPTTAKVTVGQTVQLTATIVPSNATNKTVVWFSEDKFTASVTNEGLVEGVAVGEATITVTSEDGLHEASCTVTVEAATVPVDGVTLDKTAVFLAVAETMQLTATVTPAEATEKGVVWSSSDASVTVDKNGLVTAVEDGSATITATAEGGSTARCVVTVNKIGSTSFMTATTWTVGQQTWSDMVMASGARGKTNFGGGSSGMYLVDLRENTGYGDMFTWEAVDKHKEQLCPAPWSVPTKDDFVTLDKALGGTGENGQNNATLMDAYKTTWGALMGGICVGSNGGMYSQGMIGYFWSQTQIDGDFAYIVQLNGTTVNPVSSTINKSNGFTVRCVKPKE